MQKFSPKLADKGPCTKGGWARACLVALTALCALGLAGCAGGSEDADGRYGRETTTTQPAVSRNDLEKYVVRIQAYGCGGQSWGTGVVDDQGDVVTNWHVVEDSQYVEVQRGADRVGASVWNKNPDLDLAVLWVGDKLGAGPRLSAEATGKATAAGYPGGKGFRESDGEVIGGSSSKIIFDGEVEPGNSGGPLWQNGQMVGLLYAKEEKTNTGWAYPGGIVQEWLDSLKNTDEQTKQVSLAACS